MTDSPQPAAETQGGAATGTGSDEREPARWRSALTRLTGGSAAISVLAVVLALLVGSILIAATNPAVQASTAYFFARPGDTVAAVWKAVSGAYTALFQGAVYNSRRPDFLDAIRPLMSTLNLATPLIAAGLGIGLAFRVGLFNIGGQGQMIVAAACSAWVGFSLHLPGGIHLAVAVLAGLVGGALWAGVAGYLKARTGAHEVIVTIMLNYVAFYLVSYLLRTPVLQAPGSSDPKSGPVRPTAVMFPLLGSRYDITVGFVLAIGAAVVVWLLVSRSSLGFKMRALGINPSAARTAGVDVRRTYVVAMLVSGALVGLAGTFESLSVAKSGMTSGVDAGIGFDAITVALLGRSRPLGTCIAGILFGAFKAGGFSMQAAQGVPIDIVLVVQSLIVLFIAAPPLVRSIFRLPDPAAPVRARRVRIATEAVAVR